MKDYLMSLLSRKPRNAFKFDSKVSGFDRGVWTNTQLKSGADGKSGELGYAINPDGTSQLDIPGSLVSLDTSDEKIQ